MWKKQSQTQGSSIEQELRDRVRRHNIHWQAWPEYHVCGTERRHVGFRLGLLGTYDRPSRRPVSGCAESWKVYISLHELARWILPDEDDDLQIRVDDSSLVDQGSRRDIMVTIRISHRKDRDRPVDAREVQCLAAIEERLVELGAQQG